MRSPIGLSGALVRAAALASVISLCEAAPARADELPLVSGNYSIARKFLHGDAHVLLLGDSIQNGLIGAYPKHWQVDKWSGEVVGPNLGVPFTGNSGGYTLSFGIPSVASSDLHLPDAPPPGLEGYAPGAVQNVTFDAVQAPPASNLLSNRFYEVGLLGPQEDIYASGKWADRPDGRIQVDVLVYGNPAGIESGVQLDVWTNSIQTADLTIPLSVRSAEAGIMTFSGSFPAKTWAPGTGISGTFRVTAGATPEAGSNLPVLGVRFSTGEPGFQFANIAWGGKGIDYYLNPANTTDRNLKDYIDATDSNLAFVWLGQNDTGRYTAAQWKGKVQELIARYKSARPDMDFVLVSSYDTDANAADGNRLGEYAQALYEIAQSDPDVVFLNLFGAAGDFSFLNANYLSDGVHPSLAGIDYFAGKTQELLAMADAQAPEPGALLGGAGMVWLLARRRRA